MKVAFFVMLVLSVILGGIAYHKSPELPIQAVKSGGGLLLQLIPVLILAFFVAGLIEVLLPKELLIRWVGEGSGFKGILIGTLLGAVAPGGPFIQFPIVAAMFKAGAHIGPLIAYLSAWALIGINRVIAFEIPLLGFQITFTRLLCSFIFPVIIGYLASFVSVRP
ncbi:MAG: permease [Deltaproteobacteria bacterium]|jgi:uncharacterized membrane protein YraQ (UPF0718 family)|nr:MAG: permease [Deltaproteobacteria bacterium]